MLYVNVKYACPPWDNRPLHGAFTFALGCSFLAFGFSLHLVLYLIVVGAPTFLCNFGSAWMLSVNVPRLLASVSSNFARLLARILKALGSSPTIHWMSAGFPEISGIFLQVFPMFPGFHPNFSN